MARTSFEQTLHEVFDTKVFSTPVAKGANDIKNALKNLKTAATKLYYNQEEYSEWYRISSDSKYPISLGYISSSEMQPIVEDLIRRIKKNVDDNLQFYFDKYAMGKGEGVSGSTVGAIGFMSPPGYGKTQYARSLLDELRGKDVENFIIIDALKYHLIFNPLAGNITTEFKSENALPPMLRAELVGEIVRSLNLVDATSGQMMETKSVLDVLGDEVVDQFYDYFRHKLGKYLITNIASDSLVYDDIKAQDKYKNGYFDPGNFFYDAVYNVYYNANNKDILRKKLLLIESVIDNALNFLIQLDELINTTQSVHVFTEELAKRKNELAAGVDAIKAILDTATKQLFLTATALIPKEWKAQKTGDAPSWFATDSAVHVYQACGYIALVYLMQIAKIVQVNQSDARENGVTFENILHDITKKLDSPNSVSLNEKGHKLFMAMQFIFDEDYVLGGYLVRKYNSDFDDKAVITDQHPIYSVINHIASITQPILIGISNAAYSGARAMSNLRNMLYDYDLKSFGSIRLASLSPLRRNKREFSNESTQFLDTTSLVQRFDNVISKLMEASQLFNRLLSKGRIRFLESFYQFVVENSQNGNIGAPADEAINAVKQLADSINAVHTACLALCKPEYFVSYDVDKEALYYFTGAYLAGQFYKDVRLSLYHLWQKSHPGKSLRLTFETGVQKLLNEAVAKYDEAIETAKKLGKELKSRIIHTLQQYNINVDENDYAAIGQYVKNIESVTDIEPQTKVEVASRVANLYNEYWNKLEQLKAKMKPYIIVYDEMLHNIETLQFGVMLQLWDLLLNKTDFGRPNVGLVLTGNSPSKTNLDFVKGMLGISGGKIPQGQTTLSPDKLIAFFARVNFYIVTPDYEYILKNQGDFTTNLRHLVGSARLIELAGSLPYDKNIVNMFDNSIRKVATSIAAFDYYDAIVDARLNIAKSQDIEIAEKQETIKVIVKALNNRLSAQEVDRIRNRYIGERNRTKIQDSDLALKIVSSLQYFSLQESFSIPTFFLRKAIAKNYIDYKKAFILSYAPIMMFFGLLDTIKTIINFYSLFAESAATYTKYRDDTYRAITLANVCINTIQGAIKREKMHLDGDLEKNQQYERERLYLIAPIYVMVAYKFLSSISVLNPNVFETFTHLPDWNTQGQLGTDTNNKWSRILQYFDATLDPYKDPVIRDSLELVDSFKYKYQDLYFTLSIHENKLESGGSSRVFVLSPGIEGDQGGVKMKAVKKLAKTLLYLTYKLEPKMELGESEFWLLYYFVRMLGVDSNKYHISLRDYTKHVKNIINNVIGYINMLFMLKEIITSANADFEQEVDSWSIDPAQKDFLKALYSEIADYLRYHKIRNHIISYDIVLEQQKANYNSPVNDVSHMQVHVTDQNRMSSKYYDIDVAHMLAMSGCSFAGSNFEPFDMRFDILRYNNEMFEVYNSIKTNNFANIVEGIKSSIENVREAQDKNRNMTSSPMSWLCYLAGVEISTDSGTSAVSNIDVAQEVMRMIEEEHGNALRGLSATSGIEQHVKAGALVKYLLESMQQNQLHKLPGLDKVYNELRTLHEELSNDDFGVLVKHTKNPGLDFVSQMQSSEALTTATQPQQLGWLSVFESQDKHPSYERLYKRYVTNYQNMTRNFLRVCDRLAKRVQDDQKKGKVKIIDHLENIYLYVSEKLNEIINTYGTEVPQETKNKLSLIHKIVSSSPSGDSKAEVVNFVANMAVQYGKAYGQNIDDAMQLVWCPEGEDRTAIYNKLHKVLSYIMTLSKASESTQVTVYDYTMGEPFLCIKLYYLMAAIKICGLYLNNKNQAEKMQVLQQVTDKAYDFYEKIFVDGDISMDTFSEKSWFISLLRNARDNNLQNHSDVNLNPSTSFLSVKYSKQVIPVKTQNKVLGYVHIIDNALTYKDGRLYGSLHMVPMESITVLQDYYYSKTENAKAIGEETVRLDKVLYVISGNISDVFDYAQNEPIAVAGKMIGTKELESIPSSDLVTIDMLLDSKTKFVPRYQFAQNEVEHSMLVGSIGLLGNTHDKYIREALPFVMSSVTTYYGWDDRYMDDTTIDAEIDNILKNSDQPIHPWILAFIHYCYNGKIDVSAGFGEIVKSKASRDYPMPTVTIHSSNINRAAFNISITKFFSNPNLVYDMTIIKPYMCIFKPSGVKTEESQ